MNASLENAPVTSGRPSLEGLRRLLLALVVLAALFAGWQIRNEYYLNAEYGLGYLLGICGGSMMLLLLIYPLKKHLPNARWLVFSTPTWFRIHMLLGLFGPLCILYHCNFSLGSTNSNVALGSMLLMVSSGLVGRYIYRKIHLGLYGKRLQLVELVKEKNELGARFQALSRHGGEPDDGLRALAALEEIETRLRQSAGFLSRCLQVLTLRLATRRAYRAVSQSYQAQLEHYPRFMQLDKKQQKRHLQKTRLALKKYLHCSRRIADLLLFERLFSLWHMLHLPIFFLLLLSGFIHVYAVHAY